MGTFLVTLSASNAFPAAQKTFETGLRNAQILQKLEPNGKILNSWACAASFARKNNSGTPIVTDPENGSWLLSIGTWFHTNGLRSGDEARLLRLFLEAGSASLGPNLEGAFILVIGDARSEEVIVLTDIIGNCHGFMREIGEVLAISGSSLLLASLADFHADFTASQEFLNTGVIYEERSLFREVRKLGPSRLYEFRKGRVTSSPYWNLSQIQPESLKEPEASRLLWEKSVAVARKIGAAFPSAVCDLTGGYDSRAQVASFVGAGLRPSTVVTGPPGGADVRISRGLAAMEGLPHQYFEPTPEVSIEKLQAALALTDGEYDLIEYSRIQQVHEKIALADGASINGCFGEVARGYWWELLIPNVGARKPLDSHTLAARRYAAKPFEPSLFPSNVRIDIIAHLAGVIDRTNQALPQFPNTMQMDNAYIFMRMQRWQGRIASSTNRIWPCLSPFMFRSVLETMVAAQAKCRLRSGLIRSMLHTFQPDWANFPLEHGYPAAPLSWRNFYRFAPLASYYTGRVWAKARSVAGIKQKAVALADGPLPPRLQLWSQEEAYVVLEPSSMRIAGMLEPGALGTFLSNSRLSPFGFEEQWNRLVSLELAMRALAAVGAGLLS